MYVRASFFNLEITPGLTYNPSQNWLNDFANDTVKADFEGCKNRAGILTSNFLIASSLSLISSKLKSASVWTCNDGPLKNKEKNN